MHKANSIISTIRFGRETTKIRGNSAIPLVVALITPLKRRLESRQDDLSI